MNSQARLCQPKRLVALFEGHGTQNVMSCWEALGDFSINPLASYLAQHLLSLLKLLLTDSLDPSLPYLSSADFQSRSFWNQMGIHGHLTCDLI